MLRRSKKIHPNPEILTRVACLTGPASLRQSVHILYRDGLGVETLPGTGSS